MGMPAAKKGDAVTAVDMHMIQPPGTTPPILVPHPFTGIIDSNLSNNVKVSGLPVATKDSTVSNTPPHLPLGGTFINPPTNRGTIVKGSLTVLINGKPAARNGDTVITCNDPADSPVGTVVAAGTVLIG